MTTRATPDPDTDAWLSGQRLEPTLERSEHRDDKPQGTAGRGTLSVEARRTASALDGVSGEVQPRAASPARVDARLYARNRAQRVERGARGNTSRNEPQQPAVIDTATPKVALDPPTMVAIGGSTTMQLNSFPRLRRHPADQPSASSMRVMETGLALVAIAVALLLNLGR